MTEINTRKTVEEKLARLGKRRIILNRLVEKAEEELAAEILKLGSDGLNDLMVRNCTVGRGLTLREDKEAQLLISRLPLGAEDCWVCSSEDKRKAISGLGICRGHAGYALATRK